MFAVFVVDVVVFLMFLPITTNWLFMTALFVLMLSFTIIMYGACSYNKEQEEKARKEAEEEAERKRRFERGHLEDGLNPAQRDVWNTLHRFYRDNEIGAENFIYDIKCKHNSKMQNMKWMDEEARRSFNLYWYMKKNCGCYSEPALQFQSQCLEKKKEEIKKLQKEGLVDENGNYVFWDNFPDNWKWSDEELAALDKDDNRDSADNDDWYDDYIRENPDILNAANGNETV